MTAKEKSYSYFGKLQEGLTSPVTDQILIVQLSVKTNLLFFQSHFYSNSESEHILLLNELKLMLVLQIFPNLRTSNSIDVYKSIKLNVASTFIEYKLYKCCSSFGLDHH